MSSLQTGACLSRWLSFKGKNMSPHRSKVYWEQSINTPSFSLTSAEVSFYASGAVKQTTIIEQRMEAAQSPGSLWVMFAAPASLGAVRRPPWSLSSLDPLGSDVSLLLCQAPEATITLTSPLVPWSFTETQTYMPLPKTTSNHDFGGPILCPEVSFFSFLLFTVTCLSPKIISLTHYFAIQAQTHTHTQMHCLESLTHQYKLGNIGNYPKKTKKALLSGFFQTRKGRS